MKTVIVCLFLLASLAGTLLAGEFEELRERVQARAAAVQELKETGVLREGASGLLEAAANRLDPGQLALMSDENTDRERLFSLIAARTAKTPSEVSEAFVRLARAHPVAAKTGATPSKQGGTPPPGSTAAPLLDERTGVLPMKVLTRPFSKIYSDADADAPLLHDNVPAFTIYYVYEKRDGWYQVGSNTHRGDLGWIKATDAIEWKQNLVVKFTHPDGREPVLMFGEKPPLSALSGLAKAARTPQVQTLYSTIQSGRRPPNFPVSSMEPRREIRGDDVYLLPIVNFEPSHVDQYEGRLLQLAAVTQGRHEASFEDSSKPIDPTQARTLKVDIVFVMDLTRSMQPFASKTVEMMKECATRIEADPKISNAVRFGFWGYRDSPKYCGAGIEWNTKNFTRELQGVNDFTKTLEEVHETTTDSIDFEEDVLAGVADAIKKTKWRPGAFRQLILVGDAPGREPDRKDPFDAHPNAPRGTECGMKTLDVRNLANKERVYLATMYLTSGPRWARYEPLGGTQFQRLSLNRNDPAGRGNFRFLDGRNPTNYGIVAKSLADGLIEAVQAAQQGHMSELAKAPEAGQPSQAPGVVDSEEAAKEAGREMARNMFRGALVDFLAEVDSPKPPPDVTVWASDRDLLDPAVTSLEVQTMLTRNELDSLKKMLDNVLNAYYKHLVSGEKFFQSLQAVVAATVADPGQIGQAETMSGTGLVPKFLEGLPYTSRLMSMTNDTWSRMGPDVENQFVQDLDSKLKLYSSLYNRGEGAREGFWHKLHENDDAALEVIDVPLTALP